MAVTFSNTVSNARAQRLADALEPILHPGTPVTVSDVEAWFFEMARQVVLNHERNLAIAALPPPSAFDPG